MGIKALMTGATGFTGSHLRALLEKEGIEVVPLKCDITQPTAVQEAVNAIQPDWAIHLAAKSFVADEDSLGFYQVNVLGTENLLKALHSMPKKPSKILIASSANVYGTPTLNRGPHLNYAQSSDCDPSLSHGPGSHASPSSQSVDHHAVSLNESFPPQPINHYACSKVAMEHMVKTWFDKLPIIITRPFNYTGAGQDNRFIIPKMVAHYAQRLPAIELGNIQVSRDFSDVKDVITIYHALLKSDAKGITVNVCRGVPTSLSEILNSLNALAGYQIEVKVNPALVRANEIEVLCGNNQLLRSLIQQVPFTPIQQTVKEMYHLACASCR